jgi:hypothetical protein
VIYGAATPESEGRLLTGRPLTGGPAYSFRVPQDASAFETFQIVALSRDGVLETAATLPAPPGGAPSTGRLLGVHPNPSRGGVTLTVSGEGSGSIDIVAVTGRLEARLPIETSGEFTRILWNGRDDRGRLLPAGRYWLRLMRGARLVAVEPLTLIR